MPKHTYARNTGGPHYFPTLSPSVEIGEGEIVGLPDGVAVPHGWESAKLADAKGKAVILEHPADPEPVEDVWVGDPDTSAVSPLVTEPVNT